MRLIIMDWGPRSLPDHVAVKKTETDNLKRTEKPVHIYPNSVANAPEKQIYAKPRPIQRI